MRYLWAVTSGSRVPREVVAAGLVGRNGRLLLSQRRSDQSMPDQWEFPGGKLEAGEGPEAALRRELEEEVAVTVEVGPIWHVLHHVYPRFELLMLVYPGIICGDGQPQARDVAKFAWVSLDELHRFEVIAADRVLVERLQREGLPPFLLAGT